jgi:hypothetical protein
MPEQIEQIVLDVDERDAIQSTNKANAALVGLEKQGQKTATSIRQSFDQSGEHIVRVVDRSRASTDRLLTSLERRVSMATKTGIERLAEERGRDLKRVAGDPVAIARVTSAYEKLISVEQRHAGLAGKIGDAIRNPLQTASSAAEGFISKLGPMGAIASVAAVGVGILAKKAFDLVAGMAAGAEESLNFADRLGLSVGEAERFRGAAEIANVNAGALEAGMRALSQAMSENSEEGKRGKDALERIGVATRTANGDLRPTGALIRDIARGLRSVQEPAERVRLATAILGRGAIELMPLLNNLDSLDAELRKLGIGMDDNLIKKLAKTDDQIDKMSLAWRQLKMELAGKASGVIEIVTKFIEGTAQNFRSSSSQPSQTAVYELATGTKIRPPSLTPTPQQGLDYVRAVEESIPIIQRFQQEQAQTAEGLKLQLEKVKQDRSGLEAGMAPGVANPQLLREREAQIAKLRVEETRLEAAIKAKGDTTSKIQQAEKAAHQQLIEAQKSELSGLGRIIQEYRVYQQELGVSAKANADLAAAAQIRLRVEAQKELRRGASDRLKEIEEEAAASREYASRQLTERLEYQRETLNIKQQTADQETGYEFESLRRMREARIRESDLANTQTLEGKLAVELRKADINADFATRETVRHIQEIDRRKNREIQYLNDLMVLRPQMTQEIQDRIDAVNRAAASEAKDLSVRLEEDIQAARQDAAIRANEQIRAHNQRLYDEIKQSFEGLFDAAFTKSQSMKQAFGNFAKALFLTPIKEGFATIAANVFKPILYGSDGKSGILGRISGIFQQQNSPIIVSTNVNTSATDRNTAALERNTAQRQQQQQSASSGGSWLGKLAPVAAGVGGIGALGSVFSGRASGESVTSTIKYATGNTESFGGGAKGGLLQTLKSGGAGLKDFFGFGSDSIQLGAGHATTTATMGGKLAALGKSDAMLAGGIALGADGLRRGGGMGMLETTAAGAMIGFRFGGPMGAVVGGAIGAGIGLGRWIFGGKSPEQKVIDKVRELYRLELKDKSVARQIVEISRSMGGNLDMAVRSPQARELLEMYAMSKGQNDLAASIRMPRATPFSGIQTGGQFQELPSFYNGSPSGGVPASVTPSSSPSRSAAAPSQMSVNVSVKLDPESSSQFIQGQEVQAIKQNAPVVQQAVQAAMKSSIGRRSMTAMQASPRAVLS